MDWIKCQAAELRSLNSSCGNNVISQATSHIASQSNDSQNTATTSILDPKLSNRKGAPRKLRKKGSLESTLKKAKIASTKCKGKRPNDSHFPVEAAAPVVHITPELQCLQPTPFSYS
ncbi:uncharacterized protein LOC111375555 [Olea europaea var. sylvestris]|uniref:uncharacterized protein LOC111375555 n=1 Tax=Olea europaea var. sylvestris TaxID=158386 RepID=UPI000C1D5D89|nr:uncharacterized protein LOC111375555 [Olea europaea var. sylvestris]